MCYFPYRSHSRLYITIQCQFSWKKGCRSGMPTKMSNKTSEDCQISHLQWEIGMLIKYSKGYQISQQTCWKKNTNIVLSFQYIENLTREKQQLNAQRLITSPSAHYHDKHVSDMKSAISLAHYKLCSYVKLWRMSAINLHARSLESTIHFSIIITLQALFMLKILMQLSEYMHVKCIAVWVSYNSILTGQFF